MILKCLSRCWITMASGWHPFAPTLAKQGTRRDATSHGKALGRHRGIASSDSPQRCTCYLCIVATEVFEVNPWGNLSTEGWLLGHNPAGWSKTPHPDYTAGEYVQGPPIFAGITSCQTLIPMPQAPASQTKNLPSRCLEHGFCYILPHW